MASKTAEKAIDHDIKMAIIDKLTQKIAPVNDMYLFSNVYSKKNNPTIIILAKDYRLDLVCGPSAFRTLFME